jgi:uncharacterized repeat protein (TIGR01451 family)
VAVNQITATTPLSNCPADTLACRTVTPSAQWRLTKSASRTSAAEGETMTYTVVVINTGLAAVTAAAFTDDLSDVVDDAVVGTASATTGTVQFSAPNLTWAGSLPIGGSATITYPVTVRRPDPGDRLMVNAATPTVPGGTCEACVVTVAVTPGPPLPSASAAPPSAQPATPGPIRPLSATPVTGTPLGTLLRYAVILLGLGSLALWLGRRRRANSGQ